MSSGAVAEQFLETLQRWQDAVAPRQSERLEGSAPCRQEQRVPPTHCLWRSQVLSPRKHCFVFVIYANVCVDNYATARGVGTDERITLRQFCFGAVLDRTDWETFGAFAASPCNREHLCRLPLLRPRSGHLLMDTSIVVPSRTIPSVRTFFATNGSGDELTWPCWLVNAALSRHATSRSGLCTLTRSCLRVTEALAHCSRAWPADARWITIPRCGFNKLGENEHPTAVLCRNPPIRGAERHMPTDICRCSWSFLGPVCSVLGRLLGFLARQGAHASRKSEGRVAR